MKKILTLFIAGFILSATAHAQSRVSVNINSQPAWGPVGYEHVDYYYLPDIETYYSISDRMYIYKNGNHWQKSATLPASYRNFDLYRSRKVVINNTPEPYLRDNNYRNQYRQYMGKNNQVAIRDSRDQRYFTNPGHPQYSQSNRQSPNKDNARYDQKREINNDRYDTRMSKNTWPNKRG